MQPDLSILFMETGISHGELNTQVESGWLASKPRHKEFHAWLSHSCWGLNSDPHACMASTFLSELSR